MRIRRGTREDLNEVMLCIRRVVPLMRENGNLQWDNDYPSISVFKSDIENGRLWVAQIGQCIAGFAAITMDQSPEYADVGWDIMESAIVVHRLAVDPDFRGRGVATALMLQAEIAGMEMGIQVVRLDTNSQNQATQKLLPKLGYVCAGEISLRFRPGQRFLCYEKRIHELLPTNSQPPASTAK
jgi:ribosomal protein S18 acetylase RimI-like enzyme